MSTVTVEPKFVSDIHNTVNNKVNRIKKPNTELFEQLHLYYDQVLEVYREAFGSLIEKTITYANILNEIKTSYENAIEIRDKRISQFITQDRVFGITSKRKSREIKFKSLLKNNEDLRIENLKLSFIISSLKKDIGKLKDKENSEYLELMRERDARYTLYLENVGLQLKVRQLEGGFAPYDGPGDPVVLGIALERCRDQLSITQRELKKMTEEYADTVPRGEHEALHARYCDASRALHTLRSQHAALADKHQRTLANKSSLEEEVSELKERFGELERAGTPRPQWELCGDFIGGGRARWRQLAGGLGSRDSLLALLRELGPAAQTHHLEHFDGLGLDPSIPPYLRYEGRVRNLRLSRREVSVIINDIWVAKSEHGQGMAMQDYVTKYFNDRYQQASVRAEWAYNLCSGAEQMLDEPQVKLFWGILHGHLSEDIYVGHRAQWHALKHNLYRHCKGAEYMSIDDLEKITKSTFPLKSEVDIKNIVDTVRKQLKMKIASVDVNLDRLFQENEEGFERVELARELFRQRQLAQDRYIREIVAELGGKHGAARAGAVTVQQLKRAFAIVDPAIDHIRMDRYVRWAFSQKDSDINSACPLPLRVLTARLAAGDIERVGPRSRSVHRRTAYK